jgi:biopolymer transport protein TolR
MAMGGGGGTQSVQSSPNVTPMIDVMLVLLIIFMVVTPQLLAGFTAEPPRAINLKDHPEAETDHVLGIDVGGRYYLDKKLYNKEDLGPLIKTIYSEPGREDFTMYLRAHNEVTYAQVEDAMDVAMKNGVRVMGLIGEQKPGTVSTVAGDAVKPPEE